MMEDDGSKESLQLKSIFTTRTKHGLVLGKGASSAGSQEQDKCSKGWEHKTWDIHGYHWISKRITLRWTNIAMENGQKKSWIYPLEMVIFHCYVSSPEGSHLWMFEGARRFAMFGQLRWDSQRRYAKMAARLKSSSLLVATPWISVAKKDMDPEHQKKTEAGFHKELDSETQKSQ